jgi:ketosteroid isomerase-like protein
VPRNALNRKGGTVEIYQFIGGSPDDNLYTEVQLMPTSSQTTLEEIKLAMKATNDVFTTEVIGKRNFDAVDQIYTTDARIMPPGAVSVSGRTGIKEFWAGLVSSANATAAVLTSVDVMPAGDGVVEIGSAKITIAPDGHGTSELEAKYVVYWRQEDGHWKWHVDIWNASV